MIAGAVGLTLFGMYRFLGDVEERKWVASVCAFFLLSCEGRGGRGAARSEDYFHPLGPRHVNEGEGRWPFLTPLL